MRAHRCGRNGRVGQEGANRRGMSQRGSRGQVLVWGWAFREPKGLAACAGSRVQWGEGAGAGWESCGWRQCLWFGNGPGSDSATCLCLLQPWVRCCPRGAWGILSAEAFPGGRRRALRGSSAVIHVSQPLVRGLGLCPHAASSGQAEQVSVLVGSCPVTTPSALREQGGDGRINVPAGAESDKQVALD